MTEAIKDINGFLNALFGGLLYGVGASLLYNVGACTGGMDFASFYLNLRRGHNVGRLSLILNMVVVVTGIIVLTGVNPPNSASITLGLLLTSAVYIGLYSTVIDHFFPKQRKVYVQIFLEDVQGLEKLFQEINFRFNYTIFTGIGGYTKRKRYVVTTIMTSYEAYKIIPKIRSRILSNCFISVQKMEAVVGHFTAFTLD